MIRISSTFVVALAALTLTVGNAFADTQQDYKNRRADLRALAEVFGELHYIRRTCEPRREADVWRNRMKDLIRLEQPPEPDRQAMAANFNKGYARARSRHPACDRRARDYAAARAADGDKIVRRLAAPLERAAREGSANMFTIPASEH